MKTRKQLEREYHNKVRSDDVVLDEDLHNQFRANSRFYAIDRSNRDYVYNWLQEKCKGKKVLDYCCGDGRYTFLCTEYGAQAVGIDISDVTIAKCKQSASEKQISTSFFVMDAEETAFKDDSFDFILCMGVLHHIDLPSAFKELSRIVKPDGKIICTEALGHNPLIQLYRKLTPNLRTEYESNHILKVSSLKTAKQFFGGIKTKFFHLAGLAAIPFRNTPFFNVLLSFLESIDSVLLKIPFLNRQAWMIVFELSNPKK